MLTRRSRDNIWQCSSKHFSALVEPLFTCICDEDMLNVTYFFLSPIETPHIAHVDSEALAVKLKRRDLSVTSCLGTRNVVQEKKCIKL
jgi:hypothetical protein